MYNIFDDLYDLVDKIVENGDVKITVNGKDVKFDNDWKTAWKEDHPKQSASEVEKDSEVEDKTSTPEDLAGSYTAPTCTEIPIQESNCTCNRPKYHSLSDTVAKLTDMEKYIILKTVNGQPLDESITIAFDSVTDDDLFVPGISDADLITILEDRFCDDKEVMKSLAYVRSRI